MLFVKNMILLSFSKSHKFYKAAIDGQLLMKSLTSWNF